ncbi:MAG: hypothetical protein BWY29_00295 [Microgenomates group bacterium ADurb.Bin238]|nr:MAG: hypothetical protein BWY29_00295 [Microgenomates group bacterium ADurb.Bin238]
MKIKLGFVLFGLVFLLAGSAASVEAQVGMMESDIAVDEVDGNEELDVVIGELVEKYEVESKSDLDCELVSDDDLVRLGDAVMERMHPGERHEEMDRMMGGEESEGWWNIHLQMGRNYLGCDKDSPAVVWGGAIGGMMGRMWPMAFDWDRWGGEVEVNDKALSLIGKFMPWIGLVVFLVIGVKLLLLVLVITLLVMAIRYLWRGDEAKTEVNKVGRKRVKNS